MALLTAPFPQPDNTSLAKLVLTGLAQMKQEMDAQTEISQNEQSNYLAQQKQSTLNMMGIVNAQQKQRDQQRQEEQQRFNQYLGLQMLPFQQANYLADARYKTAHADYLMGGGARGPALDNSVPPAGPVGGQQAGPQQPSPAPGSAGAPPPDMAAPSMSGQTAQGQGAPISNILLSGAPAIGQSPQAGFLMSQPQAAPAPSAAPQSDPKQLYDQALKLKLDSEAAFKSDAGMSWQDALKPDSTATPQQKADAAGIQKIDAQLQQAKAPKVAPVAPADAAPKGDTVTSTKNIQVTPSIMSRGDRTGYKISQDADGTFIKQEFRFPEPTRARPRPDASDWKAFGEPHVIKQAQTVADWKPSTSHVTIDGVPFRLEKWTNDAKGVPHPEWVSEKGDKLVGTPLVDPTNGHVMAVSFSNPNDPASKPHVLKESGPKDVKGPTAGEEKMLSQNAQWADANLNDMSVKIAAYEKKNGKKSWPSPPSLDDWKEAYDAAAQFKKQAVRDIQDLVGTLHEENRIVPASYRKYLPADQPQAPATAGAPAPAPTAPTAAAPTSFDASKYTVNKAASLFGQ
jgi:hypothetical protein